MKRIVFAITGVVMVGCLAAGCLVRPAAAQTMPAESEQRLACMGDALRLCPQFIPDREQIRRCLAAQHEALSAGCRPVFDASMKALSQQRAGRP